MTTDSFLVSTLLAASPKTIYEAWLDGEQHGAFIGDDATVEPGLGGHFTAWSGYITGQTVELEPHSLIVQAWRSSEFPEDAEDSRLEIHLAPEGGGTRIVLRHTNIPAGQGASYEQGWEDHYFDPMRTFFGVPDAPPATRKKAAPKKAAPKKAAPKKAAPKKAAPKKAAPKKAAPKKAAPKRAAPKKAAPKKAAPKKAAPKKAAPKKAAPKKAAPKRAAPKAKPSRR